MFRDTRVQKKNQQKDTVRIGFMDFAMKSIIYLIIIYKLYVILVKLITY